MGVVAVLRVWKSVKMYLGVLVSDIWLSGLGIVRNYVYWKVSELVARVVMRISRSW
jgi:hypothetical protein